MTKRCKCLLVIFCVVAAVAAISTAIWAETIRLKNGRIFEGEIVDETDDEVKIEIKSGIVYFSRDEIASIGDRKISEKDIKDATKNLENQPAEKKAETKKAPKKEQKPVKKVAQPVLPPKEVVKPENAPVVAIDTTTITPGVAVSTEPAVSLSSQTLITPSPTAIRTESKKIPFKNLASHQKNVIMAIVAIIFIIIILFSILMIVSSWKIFEKAGQPGWAAIIPIYNLYIFIKIAGKPNWWLLFSLVGFIPYIGFIVYLVFSVILYVSVARCFGKGTGFGVGLTFLPFIFMPILAFDNSTYTRPEGKTEDTQIVQ